MYNLNEQNYAIIPKTRPQIFILIKLCIELLEKQKCLYFATIS